MLAEKMIIITSHKDNRRIVKEGHWVKIPG